ncbi:ferritin-like domain-containing protein [Kineococcus indalonis]|uniref:ferritin-like domain-containing protein n=1 Tax=Kineococcus indalonis TaxID=2696566 RepID=UPI0014135A10|nr:ferritin-like domain-containing protein [Kineococcus indalonis]NAZ86448.1 DUF892 family protein [Kineococcus indalonis]
MFGRLNSPEEVFSYDLGAALTMERDTLAMLGRLEEAAQRPEVKQLLREHAAETRVQIEVVEQCFALLGQEVDDSPCPVTKALAAEAETKLKKADDSLADAVVLAGALQTEHHEQAVYENLVLHARARGAEQVAVLLESSLAQERGAGERVKALAERIARTGVATTPEGGMSTGAKAGLAAGVAAAVGAAAAVASKVGGHEESTAAHGVRTGATATDLPSTTGATGTTTGATGTTTGTTGTTTGTTGTTAGAEELNDDALEERIAESEHRSTGS